MRDVQLVNTLNQYVHAFRELINAKLLRSKGDTKSTLRLSKKEHWELMCAALDIIGDNSLAIENFLRFGLDGPTKYNEFGEKYLRLYGVLNAAYLQQEAVKKLCMITSALDAQILKDRIDALKVRDTRHRLGAHSTDYNDSTEFFVPVRIGMSGHFCLYMNMGTSKLECVDLQDCLIQHLKLTICLMDRIYEKTFDVLYKSKRTPAKKEERNKFSEKLSDLRMIKKGAVIIPNTNGGKLIIDMSPSC